MKKIILVVLTLFSVSSFGQTTYTDQAGKWRIGFNAGAMWQTCDVTAHANIAGGFTIEKILNKRADALIGFSLGFRYLSGHCTGLDTKGSYGVANNTALNGTFDSTINYAKHGGVFYNNYKTYIHEGALELKINFPKFEQKTNLIFHVMGGIGICNYKTWINALDANGNMYDFSGLQSAQSVSAADVKKVLTGSYGTLAQGSSPSGTTCFAPSVGVGFGFKLSKHAALVFEYRAAFPGTNLLDGVTHNVNNELIKQNDFYNYASANLLFTIYGRQTKSTYNNTSNYTNPTTQTNNNVYQNNPPPITNTTPVYTNQPPQVYPPYVNITYPANNFSSVGNYMSVQGNIQNIQSAQQVNISQNGYPIKYFSYDPYSGNFSFQTFLQQGTNNIIVTANSQYGTGSQGVTIFYNPPYVPNNGNVVYANGGNYSNNTPITSNGVATINTNVVTTQTSTVQAENPTQPTINIQTQTTTVPTKTNTITFNQTQNGGNHIPIQLETKPVVQFINPFASPEDVTNATYNVSATIQNVALANQIVVNVNGNNIQQFNFNVPTKTLSFTTTLLTGYNSIHISATNGAGTDVKSTVIDYKPVGRPPRIDVFNPATSPFTSQQSNMIVSGYVYNVLSNSDITATFNGNTLSFSYNNITHEIEVPVNLVSNSNQLTISATNAFGNDVKQISLILLNQGNLGVNPHLGGGIITPTVQTQPSFTVNTHNQLGGVIVPTNTVQVQSPPRNSIEITPAQTQPTFTVNPNIQTGGNQTQPSNGNAASSNQGMGGMHHQPEITRTSPGSSPYTTMSGVISISANLNYVIDMNNVSVMYDGNPVSFSYNPHVSEQLNFTSPLKPGMNTFVIKAGNAYGSVSQSVDINYVPTNPNGNVNGNPSIHFTGGINNAVNTPRGVAPNVNVQPAPVVPQPARPVQIQQPNSGGRPMIRPR